LAISFFADDAGDSCLGVSTSRTDIFDESATGAWNALTGAASVGRWEHVNASVNAKRCVVVLNH
jgi:hypothetical protein